MIIPLLDGRNSTGIASASANTVDVDRAAIAEALDAAVGRQPHRPRVGGIDVAGETQMRRVRPLGDEQHDRPAPLAHGFGQLDQVLEPARRHRSPEIPPGLHPPSRGAA